MNGLDFDLRFATVGTRSFFYARVGERSDVPQHEGRPPHQRSICGFQFPYRAQIAQHDLLLSAIPALLYSKITYGEHAGDLWYMEPAPYASERGVGKLRPGRLTCAPRRIEACKPRRCHAALLSAWTAHKRHRRVRLLIELEAPKKTGPRSRKDTTNVLQKVHLVPTTGTSRTYCAGTGARRILASRNSEPNIPPLEPRTRRAWRIGRYACAAHDFSFSPASSGS